MKVVLFTMAKKESKRLPGKNKMELKGKPLYQWTFDIVKQFAFDYYVITDDEDIADAAILHGFKVIKDLEQCQKAEDTEKAYADFILKNIEADIFIMLPFTSPIRNAKCLARDINTFASSRFYSAYCVVHEGLLSFAKGAYFMFTREQFLSGKWRDKHSLCFPEALSFNDINTIEDFRYCEEFMNGNY
jgi:CMP-N-acetylneuraminic acid synthetase